MNKLIYLEPDEEITDVIDKISKVDEKSVSLVIPRGSTLANSVVNLKLLSKRGKELGREIHLVTSDKIAKNLALQIGLPVFGSLSDAKAGAAEPQPEIEKPPAPAIVGKEIGEVEGVRVHQYERGTEEAAKVSGAPTPESEEEPVVEPEAPEVIEAVKDIEEEKSEIRNPKSEIVGEETREKSADEFKLIKKPLQMQSHEIAGHRPQGKEPLFDKVRFARQRRKRIITIIAASAAVVVLAALYVVLPKATAKISVASEPFTSNADININKDAATPDIATMTIPGRAVSKEGELEKPFAASGTKNIGEKAKGKITVYNNWDQNPISLPAGTKFSGGGAEFASTVAVSIPGAQVSYTGGQFTIVAAGTADVAVEATAVGEQSNIGPTDFTITSIPKVQQSKIYGKSTSAMAGGTNQIVKVITDKDLADAKASTEKELKEKILGEINGELLVNEKLLDSATLMSVVSETSSNKSGEQVENFNYKMKIRIDALTFSGNDFRDVLLASAKSQLAAGKDIVANKDENINYEVVSADIANGKMALKGTFTGYIADKYDVGAIKKEIKGKSVSTATKKITAHDGVISADIPITPTFLRTLPLIERRINIEFNYQSK